MGCGPVALVILCGTCHYWRRLMFKNASTLLPYLLGVLLLLVMLPLQGYCKEVADVRVVNFPETQRVKGSVTVEGAAKAIKTEGIILTRARRNEISELVYAGIVETEGYTAVSIYLQGEVKAATFLSGTIGVLLIPDEEPILRTLKDTKILQFPIETACAVKSEYSEYFSCEEINKNIGFPRYRIYLYNTLDKSAEVNTYLYLKK
jgi:hypothetical protein